MWACSSVTGSIAIAARRMKASNLPVLARARHSDATATHSYDGFCCQLLAVTSEQVLHQFDTLGCRNIGKPDDSAVRHFTQEDEFTKISVDCHKDSILDNRPLQDGGVSRIFSAIACLENVMPLFAQPACEAMTRAAIDEKFHFEATRTASSESWAMIA
jgi:hypothetical protein